MIGMNIPSIYGGILGEQYWESKEHDKFYDRKLIKSCSKIDIKGWDRDVTDISESSANEEDNLI
jgi:hypothetical protein